MSDGMGRELVYLSSHATNRYFIPNWGIYTIICLSWGYSSCALPFRLNMEFGVCQWILAIMLTCTVLCTFAFFILVAYVKIGKSEIEKLH